MLVQITDSPIDDAVARGYVESPDCGAVLVFWGVVRDHHEGRAVVKIDYQCYREMAERQLRHIAETIARTYGIGRLAVIHRVGEVLVGEASLLVVAATPHRREAFAGILALVDELKRRVPIWKREYGPDGTRWVEGVLPEPREGPGSRGVPEDQRDA